MLVRLEADLKYSVAESVSVEGLDGHETLVVVGHRDEAEALALVRLQVADHLDVLHGAERAEELPKDVLLSVGSEVVHEDAPAAAVHGGRCRGLGSSLQQGVSCQEISGEWGIPVKKQRKGKINLFFSVCKDLKKRILKASLLHQVYACVDRSSMCFQSTYIVLANQGKY